MSDMTPEVAWAMRPTGPLANLYLTAEQTRQVYEWLAKVIDASNAPST